MKNRLLVLATASLALFTGTIAFAECENGKAMARSAVYHWASDMYETPISELKAHCHASAFDKKDLRSGDEMHLVSLECGHRGRVQFFRVTLHEQSDGACVVRRFQKVKH